MTERAPFIVKPAEGRRVLHPRTMRPIPPEGQDVSAERGYFQRRLAAGDVELVDTGGGARRRPEPPQAA